MPLPWAPKSLLDDTEDWSFTNSSNRAMTDLATMGERLMQPVGRQVRSVVEEALPAPNFPQTPTNIGQTPTNIAQQAPAVPRFSLGRVEDWLTPAGPAQPAPRLEQPVTPSTQSMVGIPTMPTPAAATPRQPGMFSLPSLESFLGPSSPSAGAAPPSTATPRAGPAPSGVGDIEGYIRRAAAQRGIDPDTAITVVNAEGGTRDPVRQSDVVYRGRREQSYGPLQLNIEGGVGAAALKAGIDPRDPGQWQRAVDFGLDEVARAGWGQWHGAARVGVGNRQGIGQAPATAPDATPDQPTRPPSALPKPTPGPGWGTYTAETLTPNQFTEGQAQGLTAEQSLAICGPAAAVAFARANGRNPTLREAKELAEATGVWDVGAGMHGPASQVTLLEKMGVPATLEQGANWAAIANEVRAGRPVIVDTPQHYFTVTAAHPDGTFEFGQSAGVLKASKGRTRYRPEEIPNLGMGAPRATIFMRPGGP